MIKWEKSEEVCRKTENDDIGPMELLDLATEALYSLIFVEHANMSATY